VENYREVCTIFEAREARRERLGRQEHGTT
jgi:hypothetical protein